MKSNVSGVLELMACIYEDATIKCSANVSDVRDLMTIRSRVKSEGLSFLTITLPAFCKEFERSLADGFVAPTSFPGFARVKLGGIPAFGQGILGRIFDQETGRLRDESSPLPGDPLDHIPTLVEAVRQICLSFKKMELACTPEREQAAIENFISVERELQQFSVPESVDTFSSVADLLWGNILTDFSVRDCIPQHGPGATAERISGNQKYDWLYWYDRLEHYFPLIGTAYPEGIAAWPEELENVTIVPREEERPVRVVFVPKTLKSPRVIAIEPCCMQYTQQGIREFLYRKIENHPFTAGSVNFTDQSVNQAMALRASADGEWATLDLSDASDRVPLVMVQRMLRTNPELLDSILACRSERAQLPSGLMIAPLGKFASMGSALCFPIEAMYFYTICVVALMEAYNLPRSVATLKKVKRLIYVYGDDIIVPTDAADAVRDHLQKYHCKVNTGKSFWTGKFRESCGVDAYDGYPVTPVYVRHMLPTNRREAKEIGSVVATANLFYQKGYWRTAMHLRRVVEDIVGTLPYVGPDSEGLGWFSFMGYRTVDHWNGKLHRFEVRTWSMEPVRRTDVLEGYPALMKFFLRGGRSAPYSPGSFQGIRMVESDNERSVLRGEVTLKRRRVPAL